MLEARLDCTPIPDDLLKLTLGGRKNNHIHHGQGKEKRESARNPPEGQEVTRGTKDEIMDNCFRSHVYQCSLNVAPLQRSPDRIVHVGKHENQACVGMAVD